MVIKAKTATETNLLEKAPIDKDKKKFFIELISLNTNIPNHQKTTQQNPISKHPMY